MFIFPCVVSNPRPGLKVRCFIIIFSSLLDLFSCLKLMICKTLVQYFPLLLDKLIFMSPLRVWSRFLALCNPYHVYWITCSGLSFFPEGKNSVLELHQIFLKIFRDPKWRLILHFKVGLDPHHETLFGEKIPTQLWEAPLSGVNWP